MTPGLIAEADARSAAAAKVELEKAVNNAWYKGLQDGRQSGIDEGRAKLLGEIRSLIAPIVGRGEAECQSK